MIAKMYKINSVNILKYFKLFDFEKCVYLIFTVQMKYEVVFCFSNGV